MHRRMEEDEVEITTLEGVIERIVEANRERETITLEAALSAIGRRSFGPMLIIPGLIALSPLSGIPGVPTLVGIMIILITGQLLLARSHFWLPRFVLRQSTSRARFEKGIKLMRKVTRCVDCLLKPRLTVLTTGPATYMIAAFCLMLSLVAPLMEFLPFVISGIGAAVTAFGLALLAQDGLLALLAFGFCLIIVTLVFLAAFGI